MKLAFRVQGMSFALEAVAILQRVHETVDHVARVAGLIQHLNPIHIKRIRIAAQVAEILHHHERLVVVLRVNLGAFHNRAKYLAHVSSCPH